MRYTWCVIYTFNHILNDSIISSQYCLYSSAGRFKVHSRSLHCVSKNNTDIAHYNVFEHDSKDRISGVHVFQGSAETLVRRGGITDHHSIAYSLSNISAKNYQNRLMCIEVIMCNNSVVFWDTVYIHRVSKKRQWCSTL